MRVVTLRIYLVEDNAVIRENLAAALVDLASADVCGTAEGESQAVAWLSEHTDDWDLAIIDVFLKQGNGLGVVSAARARQARQKVVVLTNYASPDVRKRCLQLGADAVFDKSNDIEKLVTFCLEQSASN